MEFAVLAPLATELNTTSPLNQVVLTWLVDAWVITELQHVEVAPLHAAPDAVYASDVGALALHGEHRPHHVLVAVMLEVRATRREPHQPQQESGEPGECPRPLHGPSARRERYREGEESACKLCKTLARFQFISSHAKHTACSFSFSCPLLSLPLPPPT